MSNALSRWLKGRMAENRLGRNELARRSGIPTATISRILLYDHIPRTETLYDLARFFGVPGETVLELAGLVKPSGLEARLPEEMEDLVDRLFRLSEADRQEVLQNFDSILKLAERRR